MAIRRPIPVVSARGGHQRAAASYSGSIAARPVPNITPAASAASDLAWFGDWWRPAGAPPASAAPIARASQPGGEITLDLAWFGDWWRTPGDAARHASSSSAVALRPAHDLEWFQDWWREERG